MIESVANSFNDNLMDEVISSIRLKGELTDEITDIKTQENKVIDQGHNMIMIGCHHLIAMLIGKSADVNVSDPLYFAVGNSNKELSEGDTALGNELFKIEIKDIQIVGNELTLSAEFPDAAPEGVEDENYNTKWCECAIFKGSYMLNRKLHGEIDKNSDMFLKRTFKFTF